jgi:transposase
VDSPLVHFDETGILVSTKLKWLHTTCNTLFTYLFVSTKRGGKAHQEAASILAAFRGWAVHDCYGTYFTYTKCRHALCVAHLLRELQAQIEQQKLWATELKAFLLDLYQRSDKGKGTVPQIVIEKQNWLQKCHKAIQVEELLLPKPDLPDPLQKKKRGRKPRGKALSLLDRWSYTAMPFWHLPNSSVCHLPIIKRRGIFDLSKLSKKSQAAFVHSRVLKFMLEFKAS